MKKTSLMMAGLLLQFGLGVPAALGAEKAECKVVKISDLGWTDIALTNATAEFLLKSMGYEPQQMLLALNVTYESLKNREIDVFQGNWRPVQDTDYKAYFDNGWVVVATTNLEGAKYTLAVPRYAAEGGLRSFDDLQTFADKLGHMLYGIEPGSNQPLLDMVEKKAHGLDGDWQVVESSEAGMLSQVKRAIANKEWIAFMGWQPHPMNINMEMDYLSGGDAEFGPNFGSATVRTLLRQGYPEDCPNVTALFRNLVFDIDYENQGMDLIMGKQMEAADAARQMMAKHPEKLERWLSGVTTIDGQPALPVVKAALAQE
jgi:glycine betaine/proline transport system substrate-binding protein